MTGLNEDLQQLTNTRDSNSDVIRTRSRETLAACSIAIVCARSQNSNKGFYGYGEDGTRQRTTLQHSGKDVKGEIKY